MDIDDDNPEELDLPDGVVEAEDAIEVLRAWVADGALHVIFDPETFEDDVSEWGRLLADIAQHVANAVELDGQMNRADALSRLADAFDRHVRADQMGASGRIKGRTEH